jgi:anthranilate phosphoribosyltransferase
MRFVAPVRQELGIRTLMNCMGPLLNPVGAKRQLIGVYERRLVETLALVLGELGTDRALVVHGEDGLDEITTTACSHAALLADGAVTTLRIDPREFGIERVEKSALAGGDAEENAQIARSVLGGEPGPRSDIVVLNAGAALLVAGAAEDLRAGIELARQSIDSGAAAARLDELIRVTAEIAARG